MEKCDLSKIFSSVDSTETAYEDLKRRIENGTVSFGEAQKEHFK